MSETCFTEGEKSTKICPHHFSNRAHLICRRFPRWCHLERQDGSHLEILFADCNLKMLLLIDFKLDEVEGQYQALF